MTFEDLIGRFDLGATGSALTGKQVCEITEEMLNWLVERFPGHGWGTSASFSEDQEDAK